MPPPISKDDLEAIARFLEKRQEERDRTAHRRLDVREVVAPAVQRQIQESEHRLEDRSMGFERLVLDSLEASRKETAELGAQLTKVAASIPPAATAAIGAECAAVAGAKASIRGEGTAKAVAVAADRADTQSLAAKIAANRALILSLITTALGIWQAYQASGHHP